MRSILLIVAANVLAAMLGALVMLGVSEGFGARSARFSTSAAAAREALARPAVNAAPGMLKTDRVASKVNPAQAALAGPANSGKSSAPAAASAASEQAASGAGPGGAAESAARAAGAQPAAGYVLEVAAFESPVEAAQLQKALAGQGFSVIVETAARGWRIVEVAVAGDRLEAAAIRARLLERSGLDAAIVRAGS